MQSPTIVISRRLDHLLVKSTWVDYGNPDEHEPLMVPWSLRVPTHRHLNHLVHVLLNPGVKPMFDPGGLGINGVEDARNLMHLDWSNGYHDEPCELETVAAVTLSEQPWTGTVTLYGWLESQERVGLARLSLTQVIAFAAQLQSAETAGLPDGEFVLGRPWFPDAEQIHEQARALPRRLGIDRMG